MAAWNDVGPAQHGEGGEVAAEAPPADRDARQVEARVLGRQRQQPVDLVLEDRAGEVAVDAALPRRAAARRAAPVDHHHGEALVGEPLRGEVGRPRLHDPLGVRARRRGRAAPGAGRVRPASWGSRSAVARRRSPTWRIVTFGVTSGVATVAADGRAADHGDGAARGRRATPGARRSCRRRRRRVCTPSSAVSCSTPASVHRHTEVPVASSIGLAVNTTRSSPTWATARTWRSSGVTGVPPTTRRRRPSASEHTTTRPSARRAGRARRPLHPRVVAVGPQRLGGARARVGAAHLDAALVARVQREQRAVVVPRRLGEVRAGRRGPTSTSVRVAVEAQDPRGDVGVRGAGGRVGDLGGRAGRGGRGRRSTSAAPGCRRPGWRGAPCRPAPTSSRGSGPSPRRRRTPPRPTAPRGRPRRRAPGPTTGRRGRAPRAAGRRPTPPACPVGSGRGSITGARARGTDRGGAGDEVGHHELPGQRGGRHAVVGVGGVAGDAGGALPGPLAPDPLLGRQVAGVAGEQRGRVGHDALRARGDVEHPQRRERRPPGPADAQEGDPRCRRGRP